MPLKSLKVPLDSRLVPTTLFHLSAINASTAESSPLLVFLPGNPGFIDYYNDYLTLIHGKFPQFEVLGISHAGFSSLDGPDYDDIYTCEDQINHKVATIKQWIGESWSNKQRKILIMGHSLGCFILQRVVDRLDLDYCFYGLITPTVVDIHVSQKGVPMHALLNTWPSIYKYIGYVTYPVKLLPKFIIEKIMDIAIMGAGEGSRTATELVLTEKGYLRQIFALVKDEMEVMKNQWDYQHDWFLNKHGVWAVFCESDHWIKDSTRSKFITIMKEAGDTDIEITDQFTHSFCIEKSKEFADFTIKKLIATGF